MVRWLRPLSGLALVLAVLGPGPAAAQQVQTRPAHNHFAVVGTDAQTILRALGRRSLLILINDGAAVVYCTVDGTAAALNQGIRLAATGGTYTFDVKVPEGAVSCISNSGTNRVLITEGR